VTLLSSSPPVGLGTVVPVDVLPPPVPPQPDLGVGKDCEDEAEGDVLFSGEPPTAWASVKLKRLVAMICW